MQRFAQLYTELDASTATRDKVAALCRYWQDAPPEDAAWAVYFLSGGKPRRALGSAALQQWGAQAAGIDPWLFEASYQAVGDLAETIAHLLPPGQGGSAMGLSDWLHQRLLPLRGQAQEAQFAALSEWMAALDWAQRFVLIKLIGGGWRVGVSRQLVLRALGEHSGVPTTVLAQRMMGYTDSRQPPDAARYQALLAPLQEVHGAERLHGTQPYPFCLAHPLELDPAAEDGEEGAPPLGSANDWLVEWKFDGIRAQIVRRDGQCGIWSRGEELITERFPDIAGPAQAWPDGTVVDGELLAIRPGTHPELALPFAPAPFAQLQQRILRQRLGPKWLRDVPCAFVAYDLLEWQGQDLRAHPQRERRRLLDEVVAPAFGLSVSPLLNPVGSGMTWAELASKRRHSRDIGTEGLMLKHDASQYGVGRSKAQGLWWKWKTAPMTVDAVLIYAQAGHGRRASLYTDYTFAVWSRPPADESEVQTVLDAISARQPAQTGALQLVTFAKAYSGLSDAEIQAVDKVIRATTLEKFGPVRSLRPSLVFELGFEGIAPSPRHKSGLAVRFPRILRWRTDKTLREADTLDHLRHWLNGYSPASA
ncbi:ATP-dependent DNA ligase [Aquabacterium sp.]|uniref:ATP-dependent DNA ligase n=1 Tax=Aquabacterium sp. TaxID=1872578 RepID=UPI0025C49DB6|nr:ATP-dependent DNA ligase [Aquabacterium sp.]